MDKQRQGYKTFNNACFSLKSQEINKQQANLMKTPFLTQFNLTFYKEYLPTMFWEQKSDQCRDLNSPSKVITLLFHTELNILAILDEFHLKHSWRWLLKTSVRYITRDCLTCQGI